MIFKISSFFFVCLDSIINSLTKAFFKKKIIDLTCFSREFKQNPVQNEFLLFVYSIIFSQYGDEFDNILALPKIVAILSACAIERFILLIS